MARSFVAASSQYLQKDSGVLTGVPLTMTCRFYKLDLTSDTCLVQAVRLSGKSYIGLFARSTATNSNKIQGIISYTSVTATIFNGSTYTANAWHFAAFRCNSDTSRSIWYNEVSTADTTSQTFISNMDSFSVGRWNHVTPALYFNGYIAEVGTWNVALDDDELKALSKGYTPLEIRPQSLTAPLS